MTDEARRKRILDAVRAWRDKDPSTRETLRLPWRGKEELLPVIDIDLDVVLLNSRSHRLRAQLESHPERDRVSTSPWSKEAQDIVADLLRQAHKDFERLKDNLAIEGQRQPGLITREGVLINANSRTVALRDLDNNERRWIRVAVLPDDADAKELAELELRLQVQEELRAEYSLTNELLFIEELAREYGLTEEEIAVNLRWATKEQTRKKGTAEVRQRRRILDVIRRMEQLADPPIPLTFFDGKLEQLKALETDYNELARDNSQAAQRFLEDWLLMALAGQSSVHELRSVSSGFKESFLVPRLEEQAELAPHLPAILSAPPPSAEPAPSGLEELIPPEDDVVDGTPRGTEISVRPLISILSSNQPNIALPNGSVLERTAVQEAIKRAAKNAVFDERKTRDAEERLEGPVNRLREAARHLREAVNRYRELSGTPEFEESQRAAFDQQLQIVRGLVKQLPDEDYGGGRRSDG